MRQQNGTYDRTIFIVTWLLIGIGTVMLYSASSMVAAEKFGSPAFFLQRHAMRLLLGTILMVITMRVDYHIYRKLSPLIYVGGVLLLLATLGYYWSHHITTPARWLPLGFIQLQTSDIAKLAIIIYLAAYLSQRKELIRNFKHGFLPAIIMISICLGLIVAQPDFSTAATLGVIAFFILYIGRAKIWHMVTILMSYGAAGISIVLTSPYKRERLMTFLNPTSDIRDAGYQIRQSLISLGNGGLLGMGLGDSYEKNFFLPEPHTDFIFAIIGEELGFIGAMVVLFLFLLLFLQALRVARRAPDAFGTYLAAGLSASIFLYAMIHAGVVTGLLPTTGLPLPFISYGGSQLVASMASIGIILNISSQQSAKVEHEIW